ncbi:hypothetical protein KP004_14195 [Geomonas oryzisoli]|uniref:Lipoprotein n=1 Tax=Geomonas oryzisoli TaxID=2847992 RepID=A0ABX8J9Y3_9BACT|nr:hypothetical protein [Geomonas oryzisoli]QWV92355.1 hypothetical protein KP004_14195 [Geomonas oryzisoli]
MKRLVYLVLLSAAVAGCATTTPVVINDGVRSRAFIPCTTDSLCFRDGYNVTWDNWCPNINRDYPVSYRLKQFEYMSNRVEYILLPRTEIGREGGDL